MRMFAAGNSDHKKTLTKSSEQNKDFFMSLISKLKIEVKALIKPPVSKWNKEFNKFTSVLQP